MILLERKEVNGGKSKYRKEKWNPERLEMDYLKERHTLRAERILKINNISKYMCPKFS